MKAIIIEDELPSSRRLERMLEVFEYEIVARLVSVKSVVKWFRKNQHPDIIFLDIHLSDGLCFEIFKQVEIKSAIVFTTAYSRYSIQAFDYNSIAYLLKPIKKELLENAIKKATTFYTFENELLALKEALEDVNMASYKTNFTVRVGNKIKIINTSEIVCFFSDINTTYLRSGMFNYIMNTALMHLESELNPAHFFKVSRKFIISKYAVKSYVPFKNNRLKLILNTFKEAEIIVSRERVKDFKNWID